MQMNRLFQIVYYLLENGTCTAPELAEKFEVSVRTIYRDLDTLSAADIPIYATQGKGGGISLLANYILEKSLLSEKEKEQMLMALQGMSATEGESTDELCSKLSALFQMKHIDWIEVDFSDWVTNTAKQDMFYEIKKAIFDRHVISFSYFNNNRFFKLTRMKDLIISADTFILEPSDIPKIKKEIQNYNTVSVNLKFSPQVAFRVYDEFTESVITDCEHYSNSN